MRPRFALATPADDAAIRRLLRENPMRGAVSLTFEREPNYFLGAGVAGAIDQTIVAYQGDRLLCMGRCTTRPGWINGRIANVGYLGELRLDHQAQGRFDLLRGGYRFFNDVRRAVPADVYFTSLAADNRRARRLLERGLPGLPRYELAGELTTLLIAVAPHERSTPRLETTRADELATFFNACAAHHQFAAAWATETILALARHNAPQERFNVIREAGQIIAAGALWDQRPFRQTVVRGYAPPLGWARPALNAVAPLVGIPRLPAPHRPLAQAFLTPLAVAPEHAKRLPDLVAAFARAAADLKLDYLTLALPASDPRLGELRCRFRTRSYASRLYRVSWPDDGPAPGLDERPALPDVGLL